MFKQIAVGILLTTVCTAAAIAGDITISASVDRNTVALDEQLVLQVEVTGDGTNLPAPRVPEMPNFTTYSSGRSQNISIVNGRMSSSTSFRYVLAPRAKGKFTLPPITLQYDNKTYSTQPIAVDVVDAGRAAPQAASSGGQSPSTRGKELFITATIDKPSVFVNEQVAYTFRFYRKVRLLSNPQYNPPDFSGFWTEDTPPKNYYAAVGGENYLVDEVKTLLFPTRPGKFPLGSATLQCSVEDFSGSDPFADDFFRSFFSGGKTQVLRTSPLTVTVLPLPDEGKPADFSGAVGRFTVSASLDKKTVAANEPVTLSITVEGTGSVKTIPDPKLPDWPDFRKYETVSSLDLAKDAGTLSGAKTFKTVIVPLTPGNKNIAPLSFTFFDPAQKKYRTVTTTGLSLDVTPAKAGPAATAVPALPPAAGDIKIVNRDIRYLKPLAAWKAYPGPLYEKSWFIFLNIFPLLLLAGAVGFLKWTERLSSDVAFARRLRASGAAKKYLRKAKTLMSAVNTHDYYTAVARAVLTYIADKTNVSADGLTSADLGRLLAGRQVAAATIATVKKVLDECDLARFAPVEMTLDAKTTLYAEASELIGLLEKELK